MAKPLAINLAALYENDSLMMGTYTANAHRNAQRALRRRGFKLSWGKQAYYHPAHWAQVPLLHTPDRGTVVWYHAVTGRDGVTCDPGDTWIYEDAWWAKTPEARATLDEC